MNLVQNLLTNLSLGKQLLLPRNQLPITSFERFYKYQVHDCETPKPGGGKQFRRYVSYAEYRLCLALSNEFLQILILVWYTIPKTKSIPLNH